MTQQAQQPLQSQGREVPTGHIGWQPIETAPFEDVAYGPRHTAKWLSWCLLARHDKHGWVQWVGGMDAGMWLERGSDRACGDSSEPTHWMPLPAPPTSGASSSMDAAPATGQSLPSEAAKPLASSGPDEPTPASAGPVSVELRQRMGRE